MIHDTRSPFRRRQSDNLTAAQQASINSMTDNCARLPELAAQVDVLISEMKNVSTHFEKIEKIATRTTEHATTLKILSALVYLIIPVVISWNVYLAQRVEELSQTAAVYQIRLDYIKEDRDEANRNKKNP